MKTYEQILKDFIKSNKQRRAIIVKDKGFDTEAQYKEYITSLIKGEIVVGTSPLVKPTIHLVDMLDSSGSMAGGKYSNAIRGIVEGLKEFRRETEVNYTYSLIEFVDNRRIIEHQYLGNLNLNPSFYGANGSDTPLYKAIYQTMVKLEERIPKGEKVLLKVYTDGGNNTSWEFQNRARNIISKLSDTCTVTLVGPASEVKTAIRDLGLDESNTLAVENNARGFEVAFMSSTIATKSFANKVSRGEDVKTEFYSKKVGTL